MEVDVILRPEPRTRTARRPARAAPPAVPGRLNTRAIRAAAQAPPSLVIDGLVADGLGLAARKWVGKYAGPGMEICGEGGSAWSRVGRIVPPAARKRSPAISYGLEVQGEAATLEQNANIPSIAVARFVSAQ